MSDKIADSVLALFNAGLNLQTFDVVGFSIGAQFAGYICRKVNSKSKSKYTFPRIIGLEPAKLSPVNLKTSDATFVMTIHTGNFLSEPNVTGHVAFFPNGGEAQPMCKKTIFFLTYNDTICSHGQAQLFWIEAVKSKSSTTFPARNCISKEDFYNRTCKEISGLGYMNPQTSSSLMKGKYFFITNLASPYSKSTPGP